MNTIHIHLPERTFATDLQLHHLERYIMDTASCGWIYLRVSPCPGLEPFHPQSTATATATAARFTLCTLDFSQTPARTENFTKKSRADIFENAILIYLPN
jgi:hypothetical protein